MGLGRNPNGPDLMIVTVVLRYGVFHTVWNYWRRIIEA